jgi:hypothetical protein
MHVMNREEDIPTKLELCREVFALAGQMPSEVGRKEGWQDKAIYAMAHVAHRMEDNDSKLALYRDVHALADNMLVSEEKKAWQDKAKGWIARCLRKHKAALPAATSALRR